MGILEKRKCRPSLPTAKNSFLEPETPCVCGHTTPVVWWCAMLPVREAFGDLKRTQEGRQREPVRTWTPAPALPLDLPHTVILLALLQSQLLQCVGVARSSRRPLIARRFCDLDKCLDIAILLTDFIESFISVTPVLYIVYFYGNSKKKITIIGTVERIY